MNKRIIFVVILFILFLKNVSGQGLVPNSLGSRNYGSGDFSGLVAIGSILGGAALIYVGNEIHVGYNYTEPSFIWDRTKASNLKGGNGFNIEIRRVIEEKHRILFGFQKNNYVKAVSTSKPITLTYDYYYAGYIRDFGNQQRKWKPYLGGNFIYNDNSLAIGVLVGSRFIIGNIFQLENRLTISKNNINAQLGISIRYRKGEWKDIKFR